MADDSLFAPNTAQLPEMPKENISMLERITAHPEFAQLIEQKVFDPFKTRVQGKDQSRVPPGPMASLQGKP